MKQVTFIHTADIHLDMPFSSLGDEDKASQRRQELLNAFFGILDRVKSQNINLLFISGDLFEQGYIRKSTVQSLKNRFSELYKTEIIICPGNHDRISGDSYYKSTFWSKNVHILEDASQPLIFDELNCCIYCMGVSDSVQKDLSLLSRQKINEAGFNFLTLHGTVDLPFAQQNYNSIDSGQLFSLGMDYTALGHMHNFIHFQQGNLQMINPGSPEPLGFDEEGRHGYIQGRLYISEDNEKGCEWSFVNCASRSYHNIDINISGCLNDYEVVEKIRQTEMPGNPDTDLYSMTLYGYIPKAYILEIQSLMRKLVSSFYYLKIQNDTYEQVEYQNFLEDPGIKGEFVRILLDKLEAEQDGEKRDTILLAIQFGLEAMEKGRID